MGVEGNGKADDVDAGEEEGEGVVGPARAPPPPTMGGTGWGGGVGRRDEVSGGMEGDMTEDIECWVLRMARWVFVRWTR